jgi:hypothetical protein
MSMARDLLHVLKQSDPVDAGRLPAPPRAVLDEILASDPAIEPPAVMWPWPRFAWPRIAVIAAVALALIVAFSFTPPGRAVAERIGELIGIGDEPAGPTGFGNPAVVIGVGEGPDGFPYQVVAAKSLKNGAGAGETCVGLDLPELSGVAVAECLTATQVETLQTQIVSPVLYAAPTELGREGRFVIQGLVRADAGEVEVRYRTENRDKLAATELVSLDQALGKRISSAEMADFFAAFLPEAAIGGPGAPSSEALEQQLEKITLTVRDGDGAVIARGSYAELARGPEVGARLVRPDVDGSG